jgi:uncharacterized membrane protein YkvA (DUF1232 family)
MRFCDQLKSIATKLKNEFDFYRRLHQHPQTPLVAKILLWLAIAYIVMPFDLIPDFIPVIGQLDELVIIPLLVYSAIKLIPKHVIDECRGEQV